MSTFSIVQQLTLTEKRALVKELRESIKDEVLTIKRVKVLTKQQKEQEKKIKIENQIKAAAEKLAKLQAKLSA